jgi:hypothetical protein
MASGWSREKDSRKLTWHYFPDGNKPSICGLANVPQQCQETPDASWACEICKRKVKDLSILK